jgi:ubiquinone/menaquinone biosynthesis C-methylase UbiE
MQTPPKKELLVCPHCRQNSLTVASDDHRARCAGCASEYPIRDGVIDLLPAYTGKPSVAQRLMESDTVVRIYESRLWRRSFIATRALGISFDREQAMVLAAASPPPNGTVLDLACGPGIYTRALARRVGSGTVVGLDLSLPMLRYAARRARTEGVSNATFVRASALDLPLPAQAFDVVNCCAALHLFPDVPKAVGEVVRVLEPGGRFTAAVFHQPGDAGARGGDLGVHAFRSGELEGILAGAGFEAVAQLHCSKRWLIVSASKVR